MVPEDDANRYLANGFIKEPSIDVSTIQIVPPSGGWIKVLEDFKNTYAARLVKYKDMHLILLIDFDNQVENRTTTIRQLIPEAVADRVYILGVSSEPEPLRTALRKSLEDIGTELAEACQGNIEGHWNNQLLSHNKSELERLTNSVKPFLFQ